MSRDKYSPNSNTIASLVLVFLTMIAALYFVGLDRHGLFDVDEAIFAQASVEMMESGNHITPSYNGEPRYHKPPMIYWLQSLSMKYLDISAFAARLPSAVLAFLSILSFYIMIEGMTKNGRFSLVATSILGLNLSFLVLARAAVADMALLFFSLSATLLMLSNIFSNEKRVMPSVIAGFMLGGALLSKGPIGLMIPAIVVPCAVLFFGSFKHNIKRLNIFVTLVAMLVTFIPWGKMVFDQHGIDFFQEFIMKHNIERFFGGFGNTHSSSGFYYIGVLLLGFFPWVLLLPSAIWQAIKHLGSLFKSSDATDVLPLIGLIWMVVVITFFSFSATKLAHYIVPALPGAALLIAWRLEYLNRIPLGWANMLFIVPFTALFSGIFIIFKWIPETLLGEGKFMPYITMLSEKYDMALPSVTDPMLISMLSQDIHINIIPTMVGAILLIGTLTGFFFLTQGHRHGVFTLVASVFMAYFLLIMSIAPVVYKYTQQPLANIAEQIKEKTTEKTKVYFVSLHHPSIRFISGVPFEALDSPAQLKNSPRFPIHALIAVDENHVEETVAALPKSVKVEKSCEGGYCLVESTYQHRGRYR